MTLKRPQGKQRLEREPLLLWSLSHRNPCRCSLLANSGFYSIKSKPFFLFLPALLSFLLSEAICIISQAWGTTRTDDTEAAHRSPPFQSVPPLVQPVTYSLCSLQFTSHMLDAFLAALFLALTPALHLGCLGSLMSTCPGTASGTPCTQAVRAHSDSS